MKKLLLSIVISLVVGFAAASWLASGFVSPEPVVSEPVAVASFDEAAPVAERIRALEQALLQEQQARKILEEEILALRAEIELEKIPVAGDDVGAQEQPAAAAMRETRESLRGPRFGNSSTEKRVERLIAAGFAPDQAEWILRRESELQMERLQARYEAMRESGEPEFFGRGFFPSEELRAELGDADYERYLEANGRSTSVAIGSVIPNSPAQRAGLQPGDRIVRYDGERVFSMMDVTQRIMQGEEGGNVVVDIERNGMPMQLVIRRGPLGVMGN